jgi:hypothetical protein
MNNCFLAIDNVYDDPYAVRQHALTCEYLPDNTSKSHPNGKGPFPGKMSKDFYYKSSIDIKVSKLLGKNAIQLRNLDSGKFRISKLNDISKNLIHVDDITDNVYAGVVYLNTPEQTSNGIQGTILYKHVFGKNSVSNAEELKEIILSDQDKDLAYWTPELVSYITWNRLVIYPANYFHGIGPTFGDTDDTARLVQVFFWEVK